MLQKRKRKKKLFQFDPDEKLGSTNKTTRCFASSPFFSVFHCFQFRAWARRGIQEKLKWRLQGGRIARQGGEKGEGKVKTRGDGGLGGGISVIFEEEQCPLVTLAPVLLRLYCQIKRGWHRAMGGWNGSRGEREAGGCKKARHPAVTPSINTYIETHTGVYPSHH